MWKAVLPDRYYDTVADITLQELRENGIRALICDIDNTLVTYDDPVPTQSASAFLTAMREGGISVAFVSNNNEERVSRFNTDLGYFYAAKSGKPCGRELRRAMAYMGSPARDTAVVGDQIFTDIYAGKRLGLRCYLVKPIRDKNSLFFRFKRKLEIPVLRAYARLHHEAYRPNVTR